MGYFLNNIDEVNQFTKETRGKYFVDKSKMIERINKKIKRDVRCDIKQGHKENGRNNTKSTRLQYTIIKV